MKSGVKFLVFCGCAFGFWSTQALAVPVVLEMKVVKVNGADVNPTATVTIDPGDVIEIEFFASDWFPFGVFFYQITLNGATLENSPESYIDLPVVPCADNGDCEIAIACLDKVCSTSLDSCTEDADCLGNSGEICEGVCNCLQAFTLDQFRPDYLFFKRAIVFAGACPTVFAEGIPERSYAMGSVMIGQGGAIPDIGMTRYLGTLKLQASEAFCETIVIEILENTIFTHFSDGVVPSFELDLSNVLTIHSTDDTCPNPCNGIVASVPAHCSIDARQPHDLNNTALTEGWDFIDLTINDPCDASTLTTANFTLFEIGFIDIPIPIDSVVPLGGSVVRVHFSQQIKPGKWTCANFDGAPLFERVCLGYLPGDVNQDRTTAPADILAVIDCLNGVANFDCELFNTDVDRSNETGPPDILRVIDLLNGASEFAIWLDESLPICP